MINFSRVITTFRGSYSVYKQKNSSNPNRVLITMKTVFGEGSLETEEFRGKRGKGGGGGGENEGKGENEENPCLWIINIITINQFLFSIIA